MSTFAYESAAWHTRTLAAADAATRLDELSTSLGGVVARNYFGVSCDEGEEVYATLRSLVVAAAVELRACATESRTVHGSLLAGATEIVGADSATFTSTPS